MQAEYSVQSPELNRLQVEYSVLLLSASV